MSLSVRLHLLFVFKGADSQSRARKPSSPNERWRLRGRRFKTFQKVLSLGTPSHTHGHDGLAAALAAWSLHDRAAIFLKEISSKYFLIPLSYLVASDPSFDELDMCPGEIWAEWMEPRASEEARACKL